MTLLNTHFDVAQTLSGRDQVVVTCDDVSFIIENILIVRVEGDRSQRAPSDMDYTGYHEVDFKLVAAVYNDEDIEGVVVNQNYVMSDADIDVVESDVLEAFL
jgi:hypothetical protein